jgi:hypothetical protein
MEALIQSVENNVNHVINSGLLSARERFLQQEKQFKQTIDDTSAELEPDWKVLLIPLTTTKVLE